MYFLLGFYFIFGKERWGPQYEMARPKISKCNFLDGIPKTKHSQNCLFITIQFYAGETACGPKKILFLG